ncbi:MAG: thiamine-phosphate kinase [Saprospiraceae bacterium]|nr:thiamine-phosphate kinase [Saprospiraceae bacterium]
MENQRTEIGELGEFGLIERIKGNIQTFHESSIKGVGDDAAVIDTGAKFTLVSTDLLLEGVHFDLSYMPIKHLGYKAVAINVSDIAAMNGIPKQITMSIGLSNRFSVEAVDAFYEGVNAACKNYKVDLLGGDTSASASGLFISISIIGEVEKDRITYRNQASDKDILCATGDLGGAYIGLQVLEREKQVFLSNPEMQPKLEDHEYIVHRQLKPEARMDIIYDLKEAGVKPTAMIDISDGLASDLLHLCHQSNAGARIFEDKLPIDQRTYQTAVEFNIGPVTCALNGGEDYELLFSITQDDFEKIKNHPDIHFIGYMDKSEQGAVLVTKQENVVPIAAQGWDHFKAEEK